MMQTTMIKLRTMPNQTQSVQALSPFKYSLSCGSTSRRVLAKAMGLAGGPS